MKRNDLLEQRMTAACKLGSKVSEYDEDALLRLDSVYELAKILANSERLKQVSDEVLNIDKWERILNAYPVGVKRNTADNWASSFGLNPDEIRIFCRQNIEEFDELPESSVPISVELTEEEGKSETDKAVQPPVIAVQTFEIPVKVVTVRVWTDDDGRTIVETPLGKPKDTIVKCGQDGEINITLKFSL